MASFEASFSAVSLELLDTDPHPGAAVHAQTGHIKRSRGACLLKMKSSTSHDLIFHLCNSVIIRARSLRKASGQIPSGSPHVDGSCEPRDLPQQSSANCLVRASLFRMLRSSDANILPLNGSRGKSWPLESPRVPPRQAGRKEAGGRWPRYHAMRFETTMGVKKELVANVVCR